MNKFYRYLNQPEGSTAESGDHTDSLNLSRRGFLIGAAGAGFTLAGPVAVRCRRFHPCHDLLSTSVLNQGGELR